MQSLLYSKYGYKRRLKLYKLAKAGKMTNKHTLVLKWVVVILLLLAMICYTLLFINGTPEGAEEIEGAITPPAQQQPQ